LLLVCFSGVTNAQTRKQREDAKREAWKKERQEAYMANIAAFFEESLEFTQRVIERVKDGFKQTQQLSLFELDIG